MRAAPQERKVLVMKKYRVRVIYVAGFGATFDGEFLTEEEARQFLLNNVPELEERVTRWGDDYWVDKLGQIYTIVWEY